MLSTLSRISVAFLPPHQHLTISLLDLRMTKDQRNQIGEIWKKNGPGGQLTVVYQIDREEGRLVGNVTEVQMP